MITLGERIRARREELNMTPTALAAAVDVSTSAISNIENSRRSPSPQLAMRLNKALGLRITLHELASVDVEYQGAKVLQPEPA